MPRTHAIADCIADTHFFAGIRKLLPLLARKGVIPMTLLALRPVVDDVQMLCHLCSAMPHTFAVCSITLKSLLGSTLMGDMISSGPCMLARRLPIGHVIGTCIRHIVL